MQRVTHAHFETFAQARLEFVRNIAALAERPEYLESLLVEDAFGMLKGLLHDRVATVQQTAALAIGRMAGYSVELSEELVKGGILSAVASSMTVGSSTGHQKAAAFVIRSVAKHAAELAACCIEADCCNTLVWALEQLDVTVREAAAQSLGMLATHTPGQAGSVVEAGALPLLVSALGEPEPTLKRAAAAALAEVAKHTPELAMAVIEADALPALTALLGHADARVRRAGAHTLGHVVKHSAVHAEAAATARLFPSALVAMQDEDAGVCRAAAIVTREVVKHSQQLASVVVECGGIGSAVEALTRGLAPAQGGRGTTMGRTRGGMSATMGGGGQMTMGGHAGVAGGVAESARLAPAMTLGFIAAFGESLARGVIDAGGVQALKTTLLEEEEGHVRAAAVWAIGQCGRHSGSHADAIAAADVLRHVLAAATAEESSDDLADKARRCLVAVLSVCTHVPAMEALLPSCPGPLARIVLRQLGATLARDPEARKAFLASGGLKMAQAFDPLLASMAGGSASARAGMAPAFLAAADTGAADGESGELLEAINALYPAEVVFYCRPDYMHRLTKKIGAEAGSGSRAKSAAEKERGGVVKGPGSGQSELVAALPLY